MKIALHAAFLSFAILAFVPVAYAAPGDGPTGAAGQNSGPPSGSGQGSAPGNSGPGAPPRFVCREDVHTFCKDVQPGGGRIKDCLESHYKELSDACYAVLKNASSHNGGPPDGSHGGPPGGVPDSPPGGDNPPHDDPGPPPHQGQ